MSKFKLLRKPGKSHSDPARAGEESRFIDEQNPSTLLGMIPLKDFFNGLRLHFILSLLLICLTQLYSIDYRQSGEIAGLPLEYLTSFTANVRAAGFGNAYTGYRGDASSAYWNPAGLSGIYFREVSIINIPLFAGTQYSGVNFAYPVDSKSVIGMNILKLSSGKAERTNSIGENLGYTFNEQQFSCMISYSRKLSDLISAGSNFKTHYQIIDAYSQQGYNLDFGLIYQKVPEVSYGIALQNILPVNFGSDFIGQNIKAGMYGSFLDNKLMLFIDMYLLDIFYKRLFRWGAGLECRVFEDMFLRAGVNHRELTFGFGVNTKTVNFDYAVSVHQIDVIHKFGITLRYGFSPTEEEKQAIKQYVQFVEEVEKIKQEIEIEQDEIRERRKEIKIDSWVATQLFLARECIELSNYSKAEKILKKIFLKKPESVEANMMLKEIYRRTGRETISKKYMEAQNYYHNKEYSRVLEETDAVLSLDPKHKDAQVLNFLARAQVHIKEKKYSEAKGELFELLKINPLHEEGTTLLKRIQTLLDVMGIAE
jgi:tetratricopeptide (TPR) repeat protein